MSTIKRIVAILCIFVVTTIAWMLLGATIFERTYGQDETLKSRVYSTWGTSQAQSPASASYQQVSKTLEEVYEHGRTKNKLVETTQQVDLQPLSTNVDVALQLSHRQKGLLWYSTYKVLFAGEYRFQNPSEQDQQVTFNFPFPAERAIYDDIV